MKKTRNRHIKGWKRQQGVTLIELLVAGVISLIAVSGMVLVMAMTLGTSTQTIETTRLTQEMRTAMQIMTRELRRANYHPAFMACYGNPDCLGLGSLNIADKINSIRISDSDVGTNDCLRFWYDRPQSGAIVPLADEPIAAFRRAEIGGIGKIQMTAQSTSADCTVSDNWVDITDPNIIDVLSFTVNKCISNAESIAETINSAGYGQYVEKIGLTIEAKLTADASVPTWIQSLNDAGQTRTLDNFVKVRNHLVANVVVPPCP